MALGLLIAPFIILAILIRVLPTKRLENQATPAN